ncbi:MAG: alanine dehydrogenase, partial [Bacteroidota bacterium]|nr:alanine dehydrogenase [Bacteroidota bacterium]
METKERIRRLAFQAALSPQEEQLALRTHEQSLRIGIPKEMALQERRVALDPDAVGLLVAHGHDVVVETGAGVHAQFSDADYSEAGARIAPDAATVYDNDIILKVAPPQESELEFMRDRQTIFSGLQLATHPERTIEKMMDRKITAVAWDFMQDRTGIFPLVRAMGEIAGTTSILIAAEYLSHPTYGDGSMLGAMTVVATSEVVIIGEIT